MTRSPIQCCLGVAPPPNGDSSKRSGAQAFATAMKALDGDISHGSLKFSDFNTTMRTKNNVEQAPAVWERSLVLFGVLTFCSESINLKQFWDTFGKRHNVAIVAVVSGVSKGDTSFVFPMMNWYLGNAQVDTSLGARGVPALVQLFLLNANCLGYLQGQWVETGPLSPEVGRNMMKAAGSVHAWGRLCGGPRLGAATKADPTWQAQWCEVAEHGWAGFGVVYSTK